MELKNPNGSNCASPEPDTYLERLRLCNVTTFVTNDYDEVVIVLHEHYKKIQQEDTKLLAIKDEPQPKTFNFATNDNPNYWCNKLKNHTGLQQECEKRGISKDEFYIKTKRETTSILITFDKEHDSPYKFTTLLRLIDLTVIMYCRIVSCMCVCVWR